MGLRDLHIKKEYRTLNDDMVNDFYVPLLKEAKIYKRAVGFFSSTALAEIAAGISGLVNNGGIIQLVASPYLSDEDINAIKSGYAMRNKIIEAALIRELKDSIDFVGQKRLSMLATLIANQRLDIKIAFTENNKGIGMYHEKLGIVEDTNGDVVAFTGSMNESGNAITRNYEAIDVFSKWANDDEKERVEAKEKAFSNIWTNREPSIEVLEFPGVKQEIINRYKRVEDTYVIRLKHESKIAEDEKKVIGPRIPENINLYDYQKEAISVWKQNGFRGIFDMATGTGKTLTGLGGVSVLSQYLEDKLAVIIVCPYQHLVEQWVEDIIKFNIKPIIGYDSSFQKNWKERLDRAVRDQEIRDDRYFFCFICTNATFKSKYVQEEITKIKTKRLILADEAHNLGTENFLKLLDERFDYRLALSATLERHGDESGTEALYSFFGRKCIEYSLKRAIKENKLTPYKYHPVVVTLNEEELEKYEQLSYEMSKCIITGKNGKLKLSKHGEILALRRARIVAGAINKLDALREVIKPFVNDNNILVYCGATNVNVCTDTIDEEDVRQIEAVTRILGNEYNMRVAKFTADEKINEREEIKEKFQRGDRLQAIVAIKCLDEGVNIPGIKTAFILASTTNPKEYIQRRGRVLRKAPNKEFAEIFDFITLPRPLDTVSSLTLDQLNRDKTLVKNEIARIAEFGKLALNSMTAFELVWKIRDTYYLTDKDFILGGGV